MKGLVDDVHEDGTFETDIVRSADKIYAKDEGKLLSNVRTE